MHGSTQAEIAAPSTCDPLIRSAAQDGIRAPLKYRPEYPGRFDDLAHAKNHIRDFINWYNLEHHHSGIGLMTPHDVHHGLALDKWEARARALTAAFAAHPERFPNGSPKPPSLPTEIWINQPSNKTIEASAKPAMGH